MTPYTSDARQGGVTGHGTQARTYTPDISVDLQTVHSLAMCDLVSHGVSGCRATWKTPRVRNAWRYSIRVNRQWRICFRWDAGDAHDVEIVDYHWLMRRAVMATELLPPVRPGEVLLEEFLTPLELSQYRLAKDIGVPPRRINEIVHGKRAITADTALRLARYFGTSRGSG